MKNKREGNEMNSLCASRNRIGLLMATLLVAGLSACGPQQPVSQEAEARQNSRSAEPRHDCLLLSADQDFERVARLSDLGLA
jgi:hypothetical protein